METSVYVILFFVLSLSLFLFARWLFSLDTSLFFLPDSSFCRTARKIFFVISNGTNSPGPGGHMLGIDIVLYPFHLLLFFLVAVAVVVVILFA